MAQEPNAVTKLKDWLTGLSPREKLIMGVMTTVIVVFAGSELVAPVQVAFSSQYQRLEKLRRHSKDVPFVIERYVRLLNRKKEIDLEFQKVEGNEDPLEYVEKLVKGIDEEHSWKGPRSRPVGEKYEQTSVNIGFSISDLSKLVRFLDKLVHSNQPLALNKITLTKSRRGDSLDVDMEVYAIKRL